jgi:SAM-dependent methyltransferase
MTRHAIEHLYISVGGKVLELGHGNCGHLVELHGRYPDVLYYGLEISDLMNREAQRINQRSVREGQAVFQLYDGMNIPFPDNYFERVFTVNTIYFWADPVGLLKELYRVLKPEGTLILTFALQDSMKQLPFTQFGFQLYDRTRIEGLVAGTFFEIIDEESQVETIKSKAGDIVDRTFTTITLGRCRP